MAIFQILMVISFQLKKGTAQNVLVILGMYLFGVAYSPGEGPVPFVSFESHHPSHWPSV